MRVLLYDNFSSFSFVEQPVPFCGPGEVLLQVAACGICGSELESFKSRSPRRTPPIILGHEFCGVVKRLGAEVKGYKEGDRVVSNSLVSCGHCLSCRRGDSHLCQHRQLFGMHRAGAFAEYVVVPAQCLLPWPESLPAQAACLAEPLANGIHMVRLTADLLPRTVLIIGAGPIGLLAQQAFQQLTTARTIVADINLTRLRVAADLGAARTTHSASENVVAVTRAETGGEGADIVIDAVGNESTKQQSLEAVRSGGAVVWIGLGHDEVRVSSFNITIPEVRVHGTYGARVADMDAAIALLASGRIKTDSWVTTAPLSAGGSLFFRMLAAHENDIKGVLLPDLYV